MRSLYACGAALALIWAIQLGSQPDGSTASAIGSGVLAGLAVSLTLLAARADR